MISQTRVYTMADYHVTYCYTFLTVLLCAIVNILQPVVLIYTPWKYQKTFRFSGVFRWYRKATPGRGGLTDVAHFFKKINSCLMQTFPIRHLTVNVTGRHCFCNEGLERNNKNLILELFFELELHFVIIILVQIIHNKKNSQ